MEKDPFKEYLRESEPDKAHKGYAWSTAIGLQAVDGLNNNIFLWIVLLLISGGTVSSIIVYDKKRKHNMK